GMVLHPLACFGEKAVGHVQQLGECSVVQFRMRGPPGGELVAQVDLLALQLVATLAAALPYAGQTGQFDPGLVELAFTVGLSLARRLGRRFKLLLPETGAGLLAEAGAQALPAGLQLALAIGEACGAGCLFLLEMLLFER